VSPWITIRRRQHGAILARDFLPGRLAKVLTERDDAVLLPEAQAECPSGNRAMRT